MNPILDALLTADSQTYLQPSPTNVVLVGLGLARTVPEGQAQRERLTMTGAVVVDLLRGLVSERDAAHAEVERLREQVNPTTPEGKLAQWKAAEELRKNPPKVATAWEPTERKGWWARHDVHGVVIALAGDCGDFFADTSGRESSGEPSLDTAKKAADEALKAAGWELVE